MELESGLTKDGQKKRARFTEEQIIAVLKEHEAGAKTADLARKHGISEATIYNWKAKFGGMEVSEAKPAGPPAAALGLPSRSLSTLSGTRLRPIFWKAGSTSASFRCCSDIPTSDRPRATHRLRPICSPAQPARSMGSPSR